MAEATLSKLTQLIAAGPTPEIRKAALHVIGAVAPSPDKTLVKTLLDTLQDSDVELRTSAIDALGQLKVEEALPHLEPFVRQGGPELEAAVHAASHLGARGTRLMSKLMDNGSPSLRSRIAAVLARSGTGTGLVVTAHALLDQDPKVVDAAARSLAMEVPSFTTAQRHALAKFLHDELHDRKKKHSAKTEAAMLRVLGTLHEAKAEDVFWARISPPHAPEVRGAALQALGNQGVPLTDAKLPKLLACAEEADFQIVAGSLMLLKQATIKGKQVKPWLALLEATDVATRRFAVDKLRGVASADVAHGLAVQLAHPDKELRDDALRALLGFPAGRQTLLEELQTTASVDECWFLARALARAADDLPKSQRQRLFAHAGKLHDADDRRAAAIWFLLRAIDHDGTRDQIEAKADALRKKKRFAEAASYYRLMTQDPGCSEDVRFELAATGLKLAAHDAAKEARAADPALNQFTRLLQNPAFDLIGKVSKAKWLEAEDLFYLGFHFIEQTHRAREFGKQVLELLVKRSPTSALGKQAKSKLRSEGFKIVSRP